MRVFILSDLHVHNSKDPIYIDMLNWLEREPVSGDKVVFAGDVFDLFVGKKKIFISRYNQFFNAIRKVSERGVDFHFIEGNHDFLLRKVFSKIPRITVHPCEVTFDMGGKSFYISHGDEADRGNIKYLLMRKILRSSLVKGVVALVPGGIVDSIGSNWSNRGRQRRESPYENITAEKLDLLRRPYRNTAVQKIGEGFDFVIFGHTHDADEMRFQIGDRVGQYINVGFPRKSKAILQWNEGDPFVSRVGM